MSEIENIFGMPVNVLPVQEIQEKGCPIVAILHEWVKDRMAMFIAGTKNGFACALCGRDCVLAPSGQEVVAAGKNPVLCQQCFFATLEQQPH